MSRGLSLSVSLAFAWTLAAAFSLWALVTASVALRPSSVTDVVQLGAIEALVFVSGILVVLRFHGVDAPLGSSLGVRAAHPLLPVIAMLLGFSVHFPAESVDALVSRLLPESPGDIATEAALLSAPTPARLVLVIFVIACVGPLVEELFFRGALFGALRKHHGAVATVLTVSACFVMGHLSIRRWPALAVVSLTLTYVRAVSGSLLPSIALHVAFNALTVLSFATGRVPLAGEPRIDVVPTLAGWAATAMLLVAVRAVAMRADTARRGRAEDAE